METLISLITQISDFLWQMPMLVLLLVTHLFFTFRLGFIQKRTFQGIRFSFSKPEPGTGDISPYATLATSLAATIGTGNIVGIATAVAIGGPGAVFWCWITGVLGIATNYAESFLSVKYRIKSSDGTYLGGPMYVLQNVLGMKKTAKAFAFFTVLASLGVGSSVQSYSISGAVSDYLSVSPHIIGIFTAFLAGLVMLGGVGQIAKICTFLVPFMSLFYLLGCLYILACNRAYLTDSLILIVQSALSSESFLGGISGFSVSKALRIGISRGLFTNEAGLGSLPITAACAKTTSPVRQSLISMTGTFWDTVVICAITGLVIVSDMIKNPEAFLSCAPERLCYLAFEALPFNGPFLLSIALILFAFATIMGWCYYGECGAKFLFKEKGIRNFRILYLVFIYLGAVLSLDFVFCLSDLLNALMAIPNILCLFLLEKTIYLETNNYFKP